jgi:hypothetical protein
MLGQDGTCQWWLTERWTRGPLRVMMQRDPCVTAQLAVFSGGYADCVHRPGLVATYEVTEG